jgi:beta,beta-carotene 9',10'-dioxygenase
MATPVTLTHAVPIPSADTMQRQSRDLAEIAPFRGAGERELALEARLEGELPAWLAGDLTRVCPAVFRMDGWEAQHWFDGLGMLYQFRLTSGAVSYRQRLMASRYAAEVKDGGARSASFGTRAQRGLFERILSPVPKVTDNANVNVVALGHERVALTESPHQWAIDPDTLELTHPVAYTDGLGALGMIAHPHFDFATSRVVSLATSFGRKPQIVLYEHAPEERNRHVVARIDVQRMPYLHTFGLTPRHAIIIGHPFDVNPLSLLASNKGYIDHFAWRPEQGTQLWLVDRQSGQTRLHRAPAGFVFHIVNAFESAEATHIDVALYPDASVIETVRTDALLADGLQDLAPQIVRWSLTPGKESAQTEVLLERGFEFPIINYKRMSGQRHHVAYGARVEQAGGPKQDKSRSTIVRLDQSGNERSFEESGFLFGEPVFVAEPGATGEDAGVLLSVGSHATEARSALVVLDAATLAVRARAELPVPIPLGFHGSFFRA